jgi:hypothetical protein
MNVKGLEKQTTFALARELVRVRQKLDVLVRGAPWWSPYRLWRKGWIDKEKIRSGDYTAALVDRYRGLFVQIYNGLSVRGQPNRSFADFFATWWDHIESPIMGVRSSDHVSPLFWEGAEFAANVTFGSASSSIALLRPKFMLRPLIDEIRDSSTRDALRSMAYDTRLSSALSALSAADQFQIAMKCCEALYRLLVSMGGQATSRTEGAIDASLLTDKTKAVAQIRHWLFGPW